MVTPKPLLYVTQSCSLILSADHPVLDLHVITITKGWHLFKDMTTQYCGCKAGILSIIIELFNKAALHQVTEQLTGFKNVHIFTFICRGQEYICISVSFLLVEIAFQTHTSCSLDQLDMANMWGQYMKCDIFSTSFRSHSKAVLVWHYGSIIHNCLKFAAFFLKYEKKLSHPFTINGEGFNSNQLTV